MKDTITLMVVLPLLLAACSNLSKHPRNMSEAELYSYNASRPTLQQVVCRDMTHTSSRIRKRRCSTVKEIIENKSATRRQLDVINHSVPAGVTRRN